MMGWLFGGWLISVAYGLVSAIPLVGLAWLAIWNGLEAQKEGQP
jgi:hypothetical protein